MDEIVKAALKKWPNVPHCYGWLALDARGDWYMRDDRIQAAGPFPQVKGSRIQHEKLREFIAPQLRADDERRAGSSRTGRSASTSSSRRRRWVWRVDRRTASAAVRQPHRRRPTRAQAPGSTSTAACSSTATPASASCTRWTGRPRSAVETGTWAVRGELAFAQMPARFGYVLNPVQG